MNEEFNPASVPRATLVRVSKNGTEHYQPVAPDESVLNIERDLIKHLNEQPLTDEWLRQLRDYCDARLGTRAQARAAGSFVMPQGIRWEAS